MRPKWSRSGKTSSWLGRKAPPRVDQVDAGQAVLLRDLLRAQVLLHRHREVGAALHRRVVGDDHALAPRHAADAGDDPGRGHLAAVHAVRGELADLEEGRAGVEQRPDAVARQQLAAREVPLARRLPAALAHALGGFPEVRHQRRASPRRWRGRRGSAGPARTRSSACRRGSLPQRVEARHVPRQRARRDGVGAAEPGPPGPGASGEIAVDGADADLVLARRSGRGRNWCRRRSRATPPRRRPPRRSRHSPSRRQYSRTSERAELQEQPRARRRRATRGPAPTSAPRGRSRSRRAWPRCRSRRRRCRCATRSLELRDRHAVARVAGPRDHRRDGGRSRCGSSPCSGRPGRSASSLRARTRRPAARAGTRPSSRRARRCR